MRKIGEKMLRKQITIEDEFITLGQLLKRVDLIASGGHAKWYLSEFQVQVNGQPEQRRGKKLRAGDCIFFVNDQLEVMISD